MKNFSIFLWLLLAGLLGSLANPTILWGESTDRTEIVAISLQSLSQPPINSKDTRTPISLFEVTELIGFIQVRGTQEIILLGKSSRSLPPLTLDDLNFLMRCAQAGGISGPGVSLEPTEGDVASGELEVVFFGGAGGTSLGKACFLSDYLMKQIALDKLAAGVEGLETYAKRTKKRFQDEKDAGWSVLSRFWFTPLYTPVVMTDEEDMYLLKETQIGVIVQPISAEIDNKPAPDFQDEPAQKYAAQFTQLFDDVACIHPEFADLKRFMGGLKIMSLLLAYAPTDTLKYWLEERHTQKVDIPSKVPLLRDISADGRRQLTLVGGVRIAGLTLRLRQGEVTAIRDAILLARPLKSSTTWTVSFDKDWRVFIPSVSEEDQKIASLFANALIQQEEGDDAGAIASLEMVLHTYPDIMEAKFLLEICSRDLAIKKGKPDEALQPLEKLRNMARENPQFLEIPYEVGTTLQVLGRVDEAIDVLQKVLTTRADFSPAHHALGLAYLTNGDNELAKKHLNEYLRLSVGGDNKYVQEAKRTLAAIDVSMRQPSHTDIKTDVFMDEENHIRCQYPEAWKVLTGKQARDILPNFEDVKNVVVVFMDPIKHDNNLNIQVMPINANALSEQDIRDAIPELDTAYRTRFNGFMKIDASPIEVHGIKGIRYIFRCERAGVPIQQCVVTIVRNQKAYTLTFTAQEKDYIETWEAYASKILKDFQVLEQ